MKISVLIIILFFSLVTFSQKKVNFAVESGLSLFNAFENNNAIFFDVNFVIQYTNCELYGGIIETSAGGLSFINEGYTVSTPTLGAKYHLQTRKDLFTFSSITERLKKQALSTLSANNFGIPSDDILSFIFLNFWRSPMIMLIFASPLLTFSCNEVWDPGALCELFVRRFKSRIYFFISRSLLLFFSPNLIILWSSIYVSHFKFLILL